MLVIGPSSRHALSVNSIAQYSASLSLAYSTLVLYQYTIGYVPNTLV
jgi:hypothetical protein